MNAVENPYAPGAGTPPPELAGRDDLLGRVQIALERIRVGNPAQSVLMIGLRGVGKTVLLEAMRDAAEGAGLRAVKLEAPEGRSLPAMLAPEIRLALLRLSQVEAAKDLARRGLRALAGFVAKLRVKYADIELTLPEAQPEPGLADSGDLEHDLTALLEAAGEAAQRAGTALALFVDELQYVQETQLASLITALHRCAQRKLPVVLVGAGLPQLRGNTGRAKSYAERLFEFREVGALPEVEARRALERPALAQGVRFEEAALARIVRETQGYPYFIQEWGKRAWDAAARSPIALADVERASALAVAALDQSFFRVRFDRLTPNEKRYLRAMADLGAGPHRSGDIAERAGRKVTSLAPTRNALIAKGMIWSPQHGDTAFTVPLFDEFMRRIWPGAEWRK